MREDCLLCFPCRNGFSNNAFSSNADLARNLAALYPTVCDVDLFVGMLVEDTPPGNGSSLSLSFSVPVIVFLLVIFLFQSLSISIIHLLFLHFLFSLTILPGRPVSEVLSAGLKRQFIALRDGDRLYYKNVVWPSELLEVHRSFTGDSYLSFPFH